MSRNIYGLTVPPPLAWALCNPARFAVPCTTVPRRKSIYFANHYGVRLQRGDLLALHASASGWGEHECRAAALRVREAMDTSLPTHPEPYRALAGRVVAVATLVTCVSRPPPLTDGGPPDPWCTEALRNVWRQGGGNWWCVLEHVVALPRAVECSGDVGVWSLPREVSIAVMDQVRAFEARAKGAVNV